MENSVSIGRQQSPWVFFCFLSLLIGIPLLVLVQVNFSLERHREEKMQARGRQRLQQAQAVLERSHDLRLQLSRYLRLDAERVIALAEARGHSPIVCLDYLERHLQRRYGRLKKIKWTLTKDPSPPVLLEIKVRDLGDFVSIPLLWPSEWFTNMDAAQIDRPVIFCLALWKDIRRMCSRVFLLPELVWDNLFVRFPALKLDLTYFQRIPHVSTTFTGMTPDELAIIHRMLLRKTNFEGHHYRNGLREDARELIGSVFGNWMNFERLDYLLSGAAGMLAPVTIRGQDKLLCWFPILKPSWQNDLNRLPPENKGYLIKFREASSNLLGSIQFFLDAEQNWSQAGVRSLVNNLWFDGVQAAVFSPGSETRLLMAHPGLRAAPELKDRLLKDGVVTQEGDLLLMRTSVQLGRAFPVIMAVNWRGERKMRVFQRNASLILAAALAGFCAFLYMIRPFYISLRLLLPALFFLVMIPPALQGLLTVEQLVLERQFRLEAGAIQNLEKALDGLDQSLEIGMAWPVAVMKAAVASGARFPDWIPDEKVSITENRFEKTMKSLIWNGLNLSLAIQHVQGQPSYIARLFRSNASSPEHVFLEVFGSVVNEVFSQINPHSNSGLEHLPTGKELGAGVRASEIVGILQRLLFAESFAGLSFSVQSLVEMSFFGRQEFIFNLLGKKKNRLWLFQAMFTEEDFKGPVLRDWHSVWGDLALWSARSDSFLTQRFFPFFTMSSDAGSSRTVGFAEPVSIALSHQIMLSVSSGLRLYETQGVASDARLLAVGPSRLFPRNTLIAQWRIGKQQELDTERWNSMQRILYFLIIVPFMLVLVIARSLVAPLIELREMAARVARGDYQARLTAGRRGDYGLLAAAFCSMTSSLAGGKLLQLFVSESVKEAVRTSQNKADLKPFAEKRLVLFISPAGFQRRLSEVDPAQVLSELNCFLEVASREISFTRGDVDKFIGEKILAAYSPQTGEKPGQVIRRAISALHGLMTWNRTFSAWQHYPLVVGMVWGPILIGRLGSEDVRLEQALIGDTVNLASRLCDLAGKRSGNSCLLDEQTAEVLNSEMECTFSGTLKHLGTTCIKGKQREMRIVELLFKEIGT